VEGEGGGPEARGEGGAGGAGRGGCEGGGHGVLYYRQWGGEGRMGGGSLRFWVSFWTEGAFISRRIGEARRFCSTRG
jgi:hypothetical protein